MDTKLQQATAEMRQDHWGRCRCGEWAEVEDLNLSTHEREKMCGQCSMDSWDAGTHKHIYEDGIA